MSFQVMCKRAKALWAAGAATLIAVKSMLRGLPLFLSARPKSPLRVLCIMAFDTLHMLCNAKPLSQVKIRLLAALLDFGACANAAFDNKACCRHELRTTFELLEEGGIRSSVIQYLLRLEDLESRRPRPGQKDWQFRTVRSYREAVARLSLGMVAATASGNLCLDEGIRATYGDADLNLLFRIVMQCQIIDDVWDYPADLSAGLPSFLTASKSLSQALESTRLAAVEYAEDRDAPRTGGAFPLRSALFLVSICAKLVIVLGRRWQRAHDRKQIVEHVTDPDCRLPPRPARMGTERIQPREGLCSTARG